MCKYTVIPSSPRPTEHRPSSPCPTEHCVLLRAHVHLYTKETELTEFNNIYELSVQVVPTNRAVSREDAQDVVFRSESGKWNAVRREIARMHKKGRPVLVGTTSVERSEAIAELLDEDGIAYELLNAKPENDEREAEIVAQSGRRGAITIATNMAGRGTDILLGGNAEFMARLRVREALMPLVRQCRLTSG